MPRLLKRDDLVAEPYATSLGYKVKEQRGGRRWWTLQFILGDKHIWKCRDGWRCADLIGGRFVNHGQFLPLRTVLDYEAGVVDMPDDYKASRNTCDIFMDIERRLKNKS